MPKAVQPTPTRVFYPTGVKEVSDDLSTDDLVRRLKECAQAFQNMSQDDDNSRYVGLALHLAGEGFMEHSSKDVRLLVACCIADVFRVFAPEAPYKDPQQLKTIFMFFIEQLRGLEDPKDPTFKRYFYLLENLAWVKSFNICIELEENQTIFRHLFSLIFSIVNDNHSSKVKSFMLDMMCPLITEADTVSQGLLDIILLQIIEPQKTHNKNAYGLAKDILKRTLSTIEPYIQSFFNNALVLGRTSDSALGNHLYELIYELNILCPSMLTAVLPQLEFKLKCNDERERLSVTKLLARMFSDKNSDLAAQNPPLWNCFLGRFNDISVQVRMRCVQYSMHFLINHPRLRTDITESLRQRQHDPEETVRYEVVMAIISAAKKDFSSISEELLNFVKERTLDKKFKIRREALLGLAMLYKQHMSSQELPQSTIDCISWIKNKVLHVYYQTALEDRLLVERILHTCLVPYQLPIEERMQKLYQLFATVDDHAVKAFNELLKCQCSVRNQMKSVVEALLMPAGEEREKQLLTRVAMLSRNLPDSVKAQEYLMKFCNVLENNQRLRIHMNNVLQGGASCAEAERSVKEVLKALGYPVQTNSFYMIIRQMLERVAPVMVDHTGVKQVLSYVRDSLLGPGDIDLQLGVTSSANRGLRLLHILSLVFPAAFVGDEVYNQLLGFLSSDDEAATELTLQILTHVGTEIDQRYPNIALRLLPVVQNFVENGSVRQAKYAVACLNTIVTNKERIFSQVIDHLKQHFTLESQYFRTALVSLGHISMHCPDLFGAQIKSIVSKVVVKELLMVDREEPRLTETNWDEFESLPEETKVKMEGMKMMVRWLLGMKGTCTGKANELAFSSATSTLRLLVTVLTHNGDLMERDHVSAVEKSWFRYAAATCILKICCCPAYADVLTHEQFQKLALVLRDECEDVRDKFAAKLHKHLFSMRLPLQFMAIFALGGMEERRPFKSQLKQYLLSNISKRRDYLKQHPITTVKLFTILPDYIIPYAIHLLAHNPCLITYDDVPALNEIKECLWFLMEPLITKNENYSFSFFKRLIENIKQTRDSQCSDDRQAQLKLYAVCDLALGLVMTKTTSFVLKDFPQEPVLPSKLYTLPDKLQMPNVKTYLPPELIFPTPKNAGIDMGVHGGRRPRPQLARQQQRPSAARRPAPMRPAVPAVQPVNAAAPLPDNSVSLEVQEVTVSAMDDTVNVEGAPTEEGSMEMNLEVMPATTTVPTEVPTEATTLQSTAPGGTTLQEQQQGGGAAVAKAGNEQVVMLRMLRPTRRTAAMSQVQSVEEPPSKKSAGEVHAQGTVLEASTADESAPTLTQLRRPLRSASKVSNGTDATPGGGSQNTAA
ncbi:sister chromatid cohesion protein PDS5 homolog B-like [Ornithodoros turicata]|uniref:sister chromatid cohesion protein PDS5 homolog B-like n=1 Tax=Ornithodoros turicata TaxID=34597 RepID=UPI00313A3C19